MGGEGIGGGDRVLKAKSSKVIGESERRFVDGDELSLEAIEEEEGVPIVDGVLNGALRDFGTLLDLPFEGHCFYNNEWSLKSIIHHNNTPTNDPLYIKLIHPNIIIYNVTKKRLNGFKFALDDPCNLFTKEISHYLKMAHLLIRENILCTVDIDKDHLSACEAYMLYCMTSSTSFNLSHFIVNRTNDFTHRSNGILPYALLLIKFLNKLTGFNPNDQQFISCPPRRNPLTNPSNEEIPEDSRCAHHNHHD
nr:hypothetical protein [Tanacetum cinerariifolium]